MWSLDGGFDHGRITSMKRMGGKSGHQTNCDNGFRGDVSRIWRCDELGQELTYKAHPHCLKPYTHTTRPRLSSTQEVGYLHQWRECAYDGDHRNQGAGQAQELQLDLLEIPDDCDGIVSFGCSTRIKYSRWSATSETMPICIPGQTQTRPMMLCLCNTTFTVHLPPPHFRRLRRRRADLSCDTFVCVHIPRNFYTTGSPLPSFLQTSQPDGNLPPLGGPRIAGVYMLPAPRTRHALEESGHTKIGGPTQQLAIDSLGINFADHYDGLGLSWATPFRERLIYSKRANAEPIAPTASATHTPSVTDGTRGSRERHRGCHESKCKRHTRNTTHVSNSKERLLVMTSVTANGK
ncbi:hypothetical protein OG21DRAFT_1524321 [Imleria badia]|nr:hypothetical protein OG21DRAFT_1524321 [Imleria badia]